jgi:hypothetical protein
VRVKSAICLFHYLKVEIARLVSFKRRTSLAGTLFTSAPQPRVSGLGVVLSAGVVPDGWWRENRLAALAAQGWASRQAGPGAEIGSSFFAGRIERSEPLFARAYMVA